MRFLGREEVGKFYVGVKGIRYLKIKLVVMDFHFCFSVHGAICSFEYFNFKKKFLWVWR